MVEVRVAFGDGDARFDDDEASAGEGDVICGSGEDDGGRSVSCRACGVDDDGSCSDAATATGDDDTVCILEDDGRVSWLASCISISASMLNASFVVACSKASLFLFSLSSSTTLKPLSGATPLNVDACALDGSS